MEIINKPALIPMMSLNNPPEMAACLQAAKMAFINIYGAKNRLNDITNFINGNSIDLFIMVETWLKVDDLVQLSNVVVDIRGANNERNGIIVIARGALLGHVSVKETSTKGFWVHLVIDDHTNLIVTYQSPSAAEADVSYFWEKMIMLAQEEKDLVIVGDINARMTSAGDHKPNKRGNWLEKFLKTKVENAFWRINPVEGCFTTRNAKGKGITDHVFVNNDQSIDNLKIHDKPADFNFGSDHNLLTMNLWLPSTAFTRTFKWSINLLADPEIAKKYADELELREPDILHTLNEAKANIFDCIRTKQSVSLQWRQELADSVYDEVMQKIAEAMSESCGFTDNNNVRHFKNFDTDRIMIYSGRNTRQPLRRLM